MSEKPQEDRTAEPEDLIEQIIAQGLDKRKAPARTMTGEDAFAPETPPASQQENSGEAASPAAKNNRRSSAYLYLLILFGAALLMLLLAYFIQRRSSENTISDLRDSMNLSRAELLAQIKELDDQNAALLGEVDRLNGELDQWQKRYEEKAQEATDLWNQIYDAQEELYSWSSFLQLEQYYLAEDYESCAAVLVLQAMSQYAFHPPNNTDRRYEEIVKTVIREGILDEDYLTHIPDYGDLLDAYFDRLGVTTEPAQWSDTIQWSITITG